VSKGLYTFKNTRSWADSKYKSSSGCWYDQRYNWL